MSVTTVTFTPADQIPGAPRCPHKSGATGQGGMQCEKEAHHHLADYTGSDECAARDNRGAWHFWKIATRTVTLTCLAAHPTNPSVYCSLKSGHDHTATSIIHRSKAMHGNPDVAWIETRDVHTLPARRRRARSW